MLKKGLLLLAILTSFPAYADIMLQVDLQLPSGEITRKSMHLKNDDQCCPIMCYDDACSIYFMLKHQDENGAQILINVRHNNEGLKTPDIHETIDMVWNCEQSFVCEDSGSILKITALPIS